MNSLGSIVVGLMLGGGYYSEEGNAAIAFLIGFGTAFALEILRLIGSLEKVARDILAEMQKEKPGSGGD